MDYWAEYHRWIENAVIDQDLSIELNSMTPEQVEDAFYRELAFGTGGLRGTIGAGTNRMNVYTVAKASQGLADYLKKQASESGQECPSVVIGYDSRIKSDLFAKVAAGVFLNNGIKTYLWSELLPVPTVSYAVRYLKASAGIMITASHNPSRYNGYKVYGADGCQITTGAASAILNEIEKVDCFSVPINTEPVVSLIGEEVLTAFIEEVKNQSVLFGDAVNRDVAIVYTPLNGAGRKPVARVLRETGFTNITVVKEQENPDGHFPTCPYPNPEIREAMELGLSYCRKTGADILIATDPDCDRCGIAVKEDDDYRLLTGNEVGLLLLDYICRQRKEHGRMPEHPVFVKTIVTMDLAERIASFYGVETRNVLTGFKFIGEVIGELEKAGREKDYICGFEESYGYLTGSYVRDKDGVNAAFMICEMFAWYKTRGISLIEKLNEIYHTFGFCMNTLHSYEFNGSAGMVKMQEIMNSFRSGVKDFGGRKVLACQDYLDGIGGLPKSDVLKYQLEDECSLVVRPSGTEPKLKLYVSVTAEDAQAAKEMEHLIVSDAEHML